MHEDVEPEPCQAVAIIGMAARLPGARNVEEFWANLRDGVESVRAFTAEELAAAGVDERTLRDPRFVGRAGLAEELDAFDAGFFAIGRREAQIMDPQHRVFLETAWEALERAGYDPEGYDGHIGVFGGVAPNTYRYNVLNTRPEVLAAVGDYMAMICSEREYAITRVAFKLNLHGASMSVNTACSSSGVALHLACQSLLSGENDVCLVGGARVRAPLTAGYLYVEDGILAPDGRCRAFDADARGTALGSGVGMVVLKRLSEAIEDRDWIHAVIRGTAINNDGSAKVGFTAPGVRGQSAVIAEALAVAGVSADTVEYFEAHGTGTALGDPIEVAAATRAFRRTTDRRAFCAMGSVKTNIGHLDAGAGVAGVIKTALALEHGAIPASLNYSRPNPQIDFADSPFFVADRLLPWARRETPRRACVSSFGLGGTNAHVVLEEAPAPLPTSPSRRCQLLVWSARSPQALEAASANLAAHLRAEDAHDLADVAHTLQRGRRRFAHRCALVADSRADAVAVLESGDRQRLLTRSPADGAADDATARVAFLFPGGGAQYVGMGRDLYETEPVFRDAVDRCLALATASNGADLREILYPAGSDEAGRIESERPSRALPVLFSIEYGLAQLWSAWGLRPDVMIGHSMGEYTAACISGVVALEDALRIVIERGRLFEKLAPGTMLSVALPEDDPRMARSGLSIAAVNRPGSCVASGPVGAVEALEAELASHDIQCSRVRISIAAHSQMVEPILEEFRSFLSTVELREPEVPYVSNVTGTWIRAEEAVDPDYWVRHLRGTVRFADGLATLLEEGAGVLLEVGPGQTLSSFARQHPDRTHAHVVIASMRHPRETVADDAFVLGGLGKAWLAGANVDWTGFGRDEQRRRVPLPTYPFERERHWIEPGADDGRAREREVAMQAPTPPAPVTDAAPPAGAPPVPQPGAAGATDGARRRRILAELGEVIVELTGLDSDRVDPHATFLELGFDSLLLTQANTTFRRRFDVAISFRQLFEDTPTLDSLAAYIDGALPPEPAEEQGPASQPAVAIDDGPAAVAAVVPASSSAVERVIHEQMSIMREQLAVLRAAEPAAAPSAAAAAPSASTDAPAAARARPAPQGPWTPGDAVAADAAPGRLALTAHQQRHLDELVDRFTARTPGSKERTQASRARLSDPRTAAGFQLPWKDLCYPIVVERARGSKLWDVDGNRWLDVTMGFGVTLFGHSPDFITDAIRDQLDKSIAIGPQTPLAGEVAQLVCELTGHERVAFCNTGSEAVLAATRCARTVSGRDRIVVFKGSYHGMFDEVVVRGVGLDDNRRSIPIAPGIPHSAVEQVLVLDYADPRSLAVIESRADEIAAVLVEPIQSRDPELQPAGFVRELRRLTEQRGIALVFDEMVTGFRLAPGGAQQWYGVQADIATYGKVVGGGMPIGVVAGRGIYLDALDGGTWRYGDDSRPEAGVTWFAGTFVRHPLALAAAKAALLRMKTAGPQLQADLNARATSFRQEANAYFVERGFPVRLSGFGSLFHFEFTFEDDEQWRAYASLYFHYLRDRHIHCHERRPHFLTTAHDEDDIATLLEALRDAAEEMREAGFFPFAAEAARTMPAAAAREDGRRAAREVPLTDAQIEIWLASSVDDDASRAFQLSASLDLDGALDRGCLERAIGDLVQRHEALRITVSPEGESQRIAASSRVELADLDISELAGGEQDARLRAFHEADAERRFDLERGPLVRFTLIRLGETRHRVVVTAHHIICDGWSLGIVARDLGALYAAARAATPGLKGDAPAFGDFAVEQERRRRGAVGAAAEAYWLEQFRGELPVLDLPADNPRPPVKTYAGGQCGIEVGAELLSELKRDARRRGTTLFSMLLTAYTILLKRLASCDDVVIGVATAGQPGAGAGDLVGHCVNLYPFRSRTGRDEPVSRHVAEIQGGLLDSLDYADYTFGRLLTKLSVPRDPGRLPLMSTMVTYETETAGLGFGDLGLTLTNNVKRYCNFDLELYLTETRDGLRAEFHYNRDLFEPATVDRWLADYRVLLGSLVSMASTDDAAAAELALLGEAELGLLRDWNATDAQFSRDTLVHELFARTAAASPEAVAVLGPATEESPQVALRYGELAARAAAVSERLRALGVGGGDPVALHMTRTPDLLVALLGILGAGACYVPLDPNFPADRLQFMLRDSGARVVVTEAAVLGELDVGDAEILDVADDAAWPGDAERAGGHGPVATVDAESPAYVIYTSGSTGRPKGVEIPHRAVVNFLESMAASPGLRAEERILAVTTLSFDIAVLELLLPLTVGAQVVLATSADAYDGERLGELIEAHDITVMQATPATWRLLFETGWRGKPDLCVLCGGEALPRELADALTSSCGPVWNLYGPTETTVWSTAGRVGPGRITIGRPIANTQIHVLDERGRPVPIGARGELFIGGAGVGNGYWGRPELTAERFVAGVPGRGQGYLYRTGDFARWLGSGELEYLGRGDQQVKLRGFRIELGEIESVIDRQPGVRESAVVLREDSSGDARLVAYVVADDGEQPAVDVLRHGLRAELPEYMLPAAFVKLAALPRTPNRKLDRGALPAPGVGESQPERERVAPRTATEREVAAIWEQVLGRTEIGIHDDFFDLGGYSLLAARLISRLRAELGIELPLRHLFQAPTVAQFSEAVDALRWRARAAAAARKTDGADDADDRIEIEL